MDRKEFFLSCAGGLCACMAANLAAPLPSIAAGAEDWRLPFCRKRYARMLELLTERMDEKSLNEVLNGVGRYCESTVSWIPLYKGDLPGYTKKLKETWGADLEYDAAHGVITVATQPHTDCVCPLVSIKDKTPHVVCNCSLGYQEAVFETIFGKKVRAELKESVLRGGERCVFVMHLEGA